VHPRPVRQSEIAKGHFGESDLIVGHEAVLTEVDDSCNFARRGPGRLRFDNTNAVQWPKSEISGLDGVSVNKDDVLA
jgi:hypothetical protein